MHEKQPFLCMSAFVGVHQYNFDSRREDESIDVGIISDRQTDTHRYTSSISIILIQGEKMKELNNNKYLIRDDINSSIISL